MKRTFLGILSAALMSLAGWGQELAMPEERWAPLVEGQEIGGGVVHARVRVSGEVSAAERARLLAEGVRLGVPLGGGWWSVVLELSRAGAGAGLEVEPVPGESKLSEELRRGFVPEWARTESRGRTWADIDVVYHGETGKQAALEGLAKLQGQVLEDAEYFSRLRVRIPAERIKELAERQWVRAVEPIPGPAKEMSNATSALLLGVDAARDEFGVRGQGVRVAVVDGGGVDTHPDLSGRVVLMGPRSLSRHATHVAGTVAGSGNSDPGLRGMAPQSVILSYDFSGDVSMKFLRARTEENAAVANNSWGLLVTEALGNCSSYGGYGVRESEIDRVVRNEGLTVVFAAGNDRSAEQCTIAPRGGFHTMGRPAAAKNVLTVAAMDGATAVSEFSGYGPARDGRLKPDVTALGVDVRSLDMNGGTATASGTSMAAPAVSGLVALMVEKHRLDNGGAAPEPALMRALVMNTARDLGNVGPDYSHGYGLPDARRALAALSAKRYVKDEVEAGRTKEVEINVPGGTPALRVMLAWDDREGWPDNWRALVNDLDLELVSPDGAVVLPLTLDANRPEADAAPGKNRRDNAEQALVRDPAAGRWVARVKGHDMAEERQKFVVTWSFDEVQQPECLTTVTPAEVTAGEQGGTRVLAVTRPNFCGEWTASAGEADWVKIPQAGPREGSASMKVEVARNLETMARETTLEVAGRAVRLKQSAACAVTPIEFGETVTSGLTEFDCLDAEMWYMRMYEFEAEAGQAMSASLSSNEFDTYLLLVGPTNGLIAENDDVSPATTNSRIPAAGGIVLPMKGRYMLVVTSYGPRETGLFELTLRTEQSPVRQAVLREVGACPAEIGGELTLASGRDGRRGDLFPVEAYRFRGRMGQRLVAGIHDAEFDSVIYLIDPLGRQVAFNDDADGEADSRIEIDLASSGLYRLEVSGFSLRDQGRFRLVLEGCEPLEP